jgi:hypothetical protein
VSSGANSDWRGIEVLLLSDPVDSFWVMSANVGECQ